MKFTTFRRYYLDKLLCETNFSGRVLDVGGKKYNKRGLFEPPLGKVKSWKYLNIDAATKPDYLNQADNIPVENDYFDMVLMTEVLEHALYPNKILNELFRVLKNNGVLIATMPFLYPIHADPDDFQRWTPDKIKKEFINAGFHIEKVEPMGGIIAVILDIVQVYIQKQTFIFKVIKKL